MPLIVEAWSLNHWIAREACSVTFFTQIPSQATGPLSPQGACVHPSGSRAAPSAELSCSQNLELGDTALCVGQDNA